MSISAQNSRSSFLQRDALAKTLKALVGIDSVNPSYGGPEGGERRVQQWVEAFLAERAAAPEFMDALPGRPNLTARIAGADSTKTLAFITHVDTVSAGNMQFDPFAAEIRDGRLMGRGATDAKAQVAAMLHALVSLLDEEIEPPTNIELALTVDEEAGFGGAKAYARAVQNERPRPDAVVIGEPTKLEIVVAHKGTQRYEIEVTGRAGHSSRPECGVNAIEHAAELTLRLQRDYAAELSRRSHAMLGSPTVNVSLIEGGAQLNSIPDIARLSIDRRTLPGETESSVREELDAIFATLKKKLPDFRIANVKALLIDPPMETPPDAAIAKIAGDVSRFYGGSGEPIGVPFGTDGSKFAALGIPTIVVGPGSIEQAHTADEWMALDALEAGARFYRDLMTAGEAL